MDPDKEPGTFKTKNGKEIYKEDQVAVRDGIMYVPIGATIELNYSRTDSDCSN